MVKPPMEWPRHYTIISNDVWPTDPPQGSTLYEYDTDRRYKYKGDTWVLMPDLTTVKDCIERLRCRGVPAEAIKPIEAWVAKEEAECGGL